MNTQIELKQQVKYNPTTGVFTWIVSKSKIQKHANAGTLDKSDGYRKITINGTQYKEHRLAVLYMTGQFPKHQVDHINHIRHDNRWCNLREVTHSQNGKNQKLSILNTTGVSGLHWYEATKKWQVSIRVSGKKKHLGYFINKDDAISARHKAEVKYGFHKNHGGVA